MHKWNRRQFLQQAGAVAGFSFSPTAISALAGASTTESRISLAEWALNQEIRAGKFTNLDFPRIARQEFGIGAIEFVNTLFEVPTYGYLKRLKENAAKHDVRMLVLMVDDEGDPVDASKSEREQFIANHRKWVDIAQYLGCHSIRTNCRGAEVVSKKDALERAVESYRRLLEYAEPAKVNVVIENHGGLSDDAEWMVSLIRQIDNRYFGSYIDWRWREPSIFDNIAYMKRLLPFAKGMSYKEQPDLERFERMIRICHSAGYTGHYAIEAKGWENIKFARSVFERILSGQPVP